MIPKILLTGASNAVIEALLNHLTGEFKVQTTSMNVNDILCHIEYFKPTVFVYCMSNENDKSIKMIDTLINGYFDKNILIMVVGNSVDYKNYENSVLKAPDLYIDKSTSITEIKSKIAKLISETSDEYDLPYSLSKEDNFVNNQLGMSNLSEDMKKMDELIASMQDILDEEKVKSNDSKEAVRKDVKKHILIVDDDPMMLKLIKEQLGDMYNVATAISGRLALKFLVNKKTDLILLDYEMPEANGPEVLGKLRENDNTRNIPVIFLTGVNDKDKIRQVLSMRPQGYLLKPIEREKLLATIRDILK